ncbi:uncharacterized protein [Miscanthus floridulus]|uniref:uncharacterized protein n=1 Tax=Miscanthus floridulus TaxID=154761 RepID=UPI003458958F
MEHISHYIAQFGEASIEEAHIVRFFPLSLFGSAFTWFSSLEPNSIIGWADLERKFHVYFYTGTGEKKLTDLTSMRQRNNESGCDFIQRFREVRSRCYSLNLSDGQLAELAVQGMLLVMKEKFTSQEFENSDDEDAEIGVAEWTWNKKTVSCPWVKESEDTYDFDVSKADKIFDLLLEKGQLKLPPNHKIPSPEELKRRKYCKFHNASTHSTNECRVFRQHILIAIEQGKVKFESAKKSNMKIDENTFPKDVNMVNIKLLKGKAKVLTLDRAKEARTVDPMGQISTNEYKKIRQQRDKRKSRYEQAELRGLRHDYEESDEDEFEEAVVQLTLQSQQAIFDKPSQHRHLKALYMKGFVDGKPMMKMLVDGGVVVNLMPYTTFRKLGKSPGDLIETDMMLKDFGGNTSKTQGALNVELTIGSKTLFTTFFVIDGKVARR